MDNGAHFFRCDFQVHTPRDSNWSGPRPVSADDRADFAAQLVAACRAKGIRAIAVTDHHDFAFFPFIKDAADGENDSDGHPLDPSQRLVVFPGIELTLAVPCQAILILDADFPIEQLSVVLEALAITATDAGEASLPPVTRVEHIDTFNKLHEELDRRTWLKGRYIVLPNVTETGYGTLMRTGMHTKYKDMPCVGGYLDGSSQIGTGNSRIFAGKDPAWGNKRIAVFQTSDTRSATFETLGAPATWVKWAAPSAEALRQACLAQESRISHELPALPTTYVTRLSVSNSKFMGPIELKLNPQYNAIIGGRGTGKSTCLEYLRWALCDQPANGAPEDEVTSHAARRERLIAATLTPFNAHVDVHFLLNGMPHVVRRHAGPEGVALKVGDGEFSPTREEDVRSLLPIQAYSQKQLSGVSVRIDELTRFITSPIRRTLEDIDAKSSTLEARLRENYAALQRQRALQAKISRDELDLASLIQQATNLRESLGAVSTDDQAILKQKPLYDSADELMASWDRKVEQLTGEAGRFRSDVSGLLSGIRQVPADDLPNPDLLRQVEAALREAFGNVGELAEEAVKSIARATETGSSYSRTRDEWRAEQSSFEERYASAKARSAAHESKLEELEQLERRVRQLRAILDEQREEKSRLGDAEARHSEIRAAWLEAQRQHSEMLATQCAALTSLSGGLIRATLRRGAGVANFGEAFGSAVRGSGVRGAKFETFFSRLAESEDPIALWERCLDELEPSGADMRSSDSATPWPTLTHLGFTGSDVEKMVGRLSPESWLGLALARVDDHPSFEYQTKDGQYIGFGDASVGQQATALLRVLLNQAGPPLVIDQPEEDLDSQVVLEIVEQLWTAKTHRQLIFTSHNPNLVVNGDAELVICCDYRAAGDASGGRIKLEGAIDMPEIKKELTAVMEGGEAAFRLRKDKYGF